MQKVEKDLFWPVFLGAVAMVLMFGVGSAYVRGWEFAVGSTEPDSAVKADTFSIAPLPFEGIPFRGFFYRESLPFGFEDRSWAALVDWRSPDAYEGGFAAEVRVLSAYGGVEIGIPPVSESKYRTLSFAYKRGQGAGNVEVSLNSPAGAVLGKQPVNFYIPKDASTNAWTRINIPLANLGGEGRLIGGISFSASTAGVFALDDIKFTDDTTTHVAYVPTAADASGSAVDPFQGVVPRVLPYELGLVSSEASDWYAYRGLLKFIPADDLELHNVGDGASSGLFAVLRRGSAWTDYRVTTSLHLGTGISIALAMRVKDDGTYTSCNYSLSASSVQIYHAGKNRSDRIAHSPDLLTHTRAEEIALTAEVRGDSITCFLNDEKILTAQIPSMAATGTAGFESWDSVTGAFPHRITNFKVTPL